MDKKKIEHIQKLNAEIKNFQEFYADVPMLWGGRDSGVTADTLLAFLVEYPCFQQIAERIRLLEEKI